MFNGPLQQINEKCFKSFPKNYIIKCIFTNISIFQPYLEICLAMMKVKRVKKQIKGEMYRNYIYIQTEEITFSQLGKNYLDLNGLSFI